MKPAPKKVVESEISVSAVPVERVNRSEIKSNVSEMNESMTSSYKK